ncbi:cytochrome c-type biogenesis protein CcmH [Pseudomonas sp. MBT-2]|uniref:Cytochrome c-type biogenesis protein n=1 Tax=Pseudomonas baltica TaxID=2762576 RepID=A0A7X1G6L0_9PSED|nr:cytochrome c-type biogenesis protein [Pseudomonas baltica]MBC2679136.1 cytochrome c-type biogenesis protein CcmH [Pseudomonas baltica]
MNLKRWLLTCMLLSSLAGASHAAIDTYRFANDDLRERFHQLTQQLRCPKCQNQDIADSNAPIAGDLRREIHRLLTEGKSDEQIIEFMVDRYGEFVRYRPALTARTGLLWFGPAALLVAGVGVIAVTVRRRRRQPATSPRDLDPGERARLADLLAQKPLDEDRP